MSVVAKDFFQLFYQWQRRSCVTTCTNAKLYGTKPSSKASRYLPTSSRAFYSNSSQPFTQVEKASQSNTGDAVVSRGKSSGADGPNLVRRIGVSRIAKRTDFPLPAIQKLPPSTNAGLIRHVTSNPVKQNKAMSQQMRNIMRKVPHSVIVLTTASPIYSTSEQTSHDGLKKSKWKGYQGMTLSSFSTLTLDPEPIVMFSIRKPSRTLQALQTSRHCLIHLLAGNEDGAMIADSFAHGHERNKSTGQGPDPDPFDNLSIVNHKTLVMTPDNQKVMLPLPSIAESGTKTILHCEIEDVKSPGFLEVGDHVIVFAKVLKNITEHIEGKAFGQQEHGLGYVEGKYRSIGRVLEVQDKFTTKTNVEARTKDNEAESLAEDDAVVDETEALLRLAHNNAQ